MADWHRMFDAGLSVQPPLSDEQLSAVPAKRGVLCLLDEQARPIVLLTAADMRLRLRSRLAEPVEDVRKRSADLRQITRRILWKLATSHFEADLDYLELARAIWPQSYGSLLAWRQAWFVHVDPHEQFPRFARTCDVFERLGTYLGPFDRPADADRFIEAIQDAFDLCRDYQCLRLAPHAPPCAYAQMGKCLAVGDGTTSLEDYRQVMARAAAFAAGDRQQFSATLAEQMKQAARELRFERAAAIKAKLQRLSELDRAAYRHVAPAERFAFISVQSGRGSRQAKVFLADRGEIAAGPALNYPLSAEQVQAVLEAMRRFVAAGGPQRSLPSDDRFALQARRWRIGLVSQYLFSGRARRGVLLRWSEGLTASELASAVESSAGQLGLKAPAPRKARGKAGQESPAEERSAPG